MVSDAKMYLVYEEMMEELARADEKYGPMLEQKEGMRTILCEIAELHREVDRVNQDPAAKRAEAVQCGSMVFKMIRDCC